MGTIQQDSIDLNGFWDGLIKRVNLFLGKLVLKNAPWWCYFIIDEFLFFLLFVLGACIIGGIVVFMNTDTGLKLLEQSAFEKDSGVLPVRRATLSEIIKISEILFLFVGYPIVSICRLFSWTVARFIDRNDKVKGYTGIHDR